MILLSLCKRWHGPNLGEVEFSEIIRRLADAFAKASPWEKSKWLDQRTNVRLTTLFKHCLAHPRKPSGLGE
ncbi:hypothetical protein BH23BAC3_BH23BAC3_12090 [soil metagenome]